MGGRSERGFLSAVAAAAPSKGQAVSRGVHGWCGRVVRLGGPPAIDACPNSAPTSWGSRQAEALVVSVRIPGGRDPLPDRRTQGL